MTDLTTNEMISGPYPAFAASPSSPFRSRPCGLQSGVAEYRKADQLWHSATDALLIGDYAEFDRLMREFRSISREWRK